MNKASKKQISATDLYNFIKCRYRPFMDCNGDPSLKIEVHPLIKLLWEAGVQHEDRLIKQLKEKYSDKSFVEIGLTGATSEELFQQTIDAMKNGTDYIYQGTLISGDKIGRPDLIFKMPGKSRFGNYLYYPLDIKFAQVEDTWDDGNEKLTKGQIWQLYFYGELLGDVQKVRPSKGYIYKTESRKLPYSLDRPPYRFDDGVNTLRSYINGDPKGNEPAIGSPCNICEWKNYCIKWAEARNDISLLYFVGAAMKTGLKKLGINTVDDLIKQDPEKLLSQVTKLKKNGYFWKSMPSDLVHKSIRRAKIYKADKPVIHETIEFPDSDKEIHYDIEDDPTQDFVYLHGLVFAQKGKEPVYHAFFADKTEEEEHITKQFFDFLREHRDVPVYHYSAHEKTTLKRLIGKYPSLGDDVFEQLFGENGTGVDLYKIINEKTDWPRTSYSIKAICKYLGFNWTAENASGAASIVWMNDYLAGDKAMKDKILRYNEDDCQATCFLKNKLIEMQK